MKIESLTKEQEKQLIQHREEYLKAGLSCEPINKELAIKSISKMYSLIGKKEPYFWVCDSPFQIQLVIHILKNIKLQKGDSLRANLWANLRANLVDNLSANLGANLSANLWSNLSDSLRANLWSNLSANLSANLVDNLSANLGNNLWSNLSDNLRANLNANLVDNLSPNLRANLGNNLWSNLRVNLWSNLRVNLSDNLWDSLRDKLGDNLSANLVDNLSPNLSANLGDNLSANLWNNLWSNLRANLSDNLWDSLRDKLGDNLGDNLRVNLWDNLRDNLGNNLWSNLSDNLRANLGDNLRDNLRANLWASVFWGQMDLYWVCYYQYARNFLGIDYKQHQSILNLWDDVGHSCGWWYPYGNICFVSDRPKVIYKNERGQLHKDGAPALEFRDGYSLWVLNGINVPEYLAKTPESELDIDFYKNEKNADVKAQFVLKYGIQRMESMGEIIDSYKNYSNQMYKESEYMLINMGKVFNIDRAIFLRMRNQTVKEIFHLEGVSPECNTIEDALRFRANGREILIEGIK